MPVAPEPRLNGGPTRPSILRPQPARAQLAARRLTITAVASRIGVSAPHLGRVLNGTQPASPRLRAALATLLKLGEDQLFRTEEQERELDDAVEVLVRSTLDRGIPLEISDPVIIDRVVEVLQNAMEHPSTRAAS